MIERARTPEQRAEREAQLEGPEFPPGGLHLWRWFQELRRRRGGDEGPITFEAVDAWNRVLRIGATPWEVATIMAIDDAYRAGRAVGQDDDS